MIENVFAILALIWFIISIFFAIFLAAQSDNESKTMAVCLKELVEELFYDRNIFGTLISSLVCVLLIPTGILTVLVSVLCLVGRFICYIWHLGDKKN